MRMTTIIIITIIIIIMYIYHALVDALSIHSCRVNLAPASMKGSSPEGNDSEPWDKAGSPKFVSSVHSDRLIIIAVSHSNFINTLIFEI